MVDELNGRQMRIPRITPNSEEEHYVLSNYPKDLSKTELGRFARSIGVSREAVETVLRRNGILPKFATTKSIFPMQSNSMKITESQLRNVISESIKNILKEQHINESTDLEDAIEYDIDSIIEKYSNYGLSERKVAQTIIAYLKREYGNQFPPKDATNKFPDGM